MARLVVLDRKLNQKHIEMVDNLPNTIDIISPQKTNFEIKLNNLISVGDLVYVTKDSNNYLGTVFEIKNENTSVLYTYPIISVLDVPVIMRDINGDVFSWIKTTLEENFNSNDILFNLPLTIENKTYSGASLKHSFDSDNLFEALITIFKKTGVYLNFDLIFTDNGRPESILCEVHNNNDESVINMREDNPLMIKKPIYNFDYSGTNKVIYKPTESGSIYSMYLLKNNTITSDANAEGRITPIVQEIHEYEKESDIIQDAEETMLGNINQFNIQIQLKSNKNYLLTPFRKFNLVCKDNIYETYITKVVNHNDEYYDIVLGVVRNTLTDKLKEVSKSKSVSTKTSSGSGGSSVGVVDSLTSNSTIDALSANQGRILKEFVDKSFVQVNINSKTGLFTFTKQDGSFVQIDTLLEKVVINFDYDESTQEIVLTLEDGTEKKIPMTAFIDDYVGVDGEIITISISNDNQVSATIKNGTITLDKLTTELQDLVTKVNRLTKNDVGLNNVDNTKDIDKPISLDVQKALSQKASIKLLPSNTANDWTAQTTNYANYGFESVGYGNGKFLVSKYNSFTTPNAGYVLSETEDFVTFQDVFSAKQFYSNDTRNLYIRKITYFNGRWILLVVDENYLRIFRPKQGDSSSYIFPTNLYMATNTTIQEITCFRVIDENLFISAKLGTSSKPEYYTGVYNLKTDTATQFTTVSGSVYDVVHNGNEYVLLGNSISYTTTNFASLTEISSSIRFGSYTYATMLYIDNNYIINVGHNRKESSESYSKVYKGVSLNLLQEIETGFDKSYIMDYNLGAYVFAGQSLSYVVVSRDLETFEKIDIENAIGVPINLIYIDGEYYLIGNRISNTNTIARATVSTFASANASNLTNKDIANWRSKLNIQNIVYDEQTKTLTITTE